MLLLIYPAHASEQIVGYFYNATGAIMRLWHGDQTPYRFLDAKPSLQQIPAPEVKNSQKFLFALPGNESNYSVFDVIKNGKDKIKADYVIIFEKAKNNVGISVRAMSKKEFDEELAKQIRKEIEECNVVPRGPSKIIAEYAV